MTDFEELKTHLINHLDFNLFVAEVGESNPLNAFLNEVRKLSQEYQKSISNAATEQEMVKILQQYKKDFVLKYQGVTSFLPSNPTLSEQISNYYHIDLNLDNPQILINNHKSTGFIYKLLPFLYNRSIDNSIDQEKDRWCQKITNDCKLNFFKVVNCNKITVKQLSSLHSKILLLADNLQCEPKDLFLDSTFSLSIGSGMINTLGHYMPSTRTICIADLDSLTPSTILHELIHGVDNVCAQKMGMPKDCYVSDIDEGSLEIKIKGLDEKWQSITKNLISFSCFVLEKSLPIDYKENEKKLLLLAQASEKLLYTTLGASYFSCSHDQQKMLLSKSQSIVLQASCMIEKDKSITSLSAQAQMLEFAKNHNIEPVFAKNMPPHIKTVAQQSLNEDLTTLCSLIENSPKAPLISKSSIKSHLLSLLNKNPLLIGIDFASQKLFGEKLLMPQNYWTCKIEVIAREAEGIYKKIASSKNTFCSTSKSLVGLFNHKNVQEQRQLDNSTSSTNVPQNLKQ